MEYKVLRLGLPTEIPTKREKFLTVNHFGTLEPDQILKETRGVHNERRYY